MSSNLTAIAQQFTRAAIDDIAALGNGLINDTYRVVSADQHFVLQRINARVFPQPKQVIANGLRLSLHIAQQPAQQVQLQIPGPLPALSGEHFALSDAQVWRALPLISPAESREQLSNNEEAQQVGFALAHFHGLCSALPGEDLFDTLPGFHITPQYLNAFDAVMHSEATREQNDLLKQCLDYVETRRAQADVLESAKQRGELRERVIHGDPKLNNFLFEPNTNRIISLIDLDTVKPGLIHYDIGDCLRSCCHLDEGNRFDLARCQIILQAYCREAASFMTEADYTYLYDAIWLIPFELGLRFLTDYLQGDVYFKVQYPQHNLQRAQAQFALCRDVLDQGTEIKSLLEQYAKTWVNKKR